MNAEGMIFWSPGITLDAIEKQVILKAYEFYQRDKQATALALGIAIRTLYSRFEKYELEEQKEKEGRAHERRDRENFLARSRGLAPPHPEKASLPAATGLRLEPASGSAAQHEVPVSERDEAQSVLPQKTAVGSAKKFR